MMARNAMPVIDGDGHVIEDWDALLHICRISKLGFMEAGISWLQTCLGRFDRGWETHIQYDPRRDYIQLQEGENVSAYVRRHIEAGRIFVGCEGTEKSLHHLVEAVGNKVLQRLSARGQ